MTHDEYLEVTRQYNTIFYFDDNLHLKESDETKYLLTGYDFNSCATVYKVYKQQLRFAEYEFKTGLQLANMTSFKDGIEWLARKIIEVIDAQGDDNIETLGTIEEICKIKIKQNNKNREVKL